MAQKVDLAAKLVHAVLQCGAHELYETLRIGRDASRDVTGHCVTCGRRSARGLKQQKRTRRWRTPNPGSRLRTCNTDDLSVAPRTPSSYRATWRASAATDT